MENNIDYRNAKLKHEASWRRKKHQALLALKGDDRGATLDSPLALGQGSRSAIAFAATAKRAAMYIILARTQSIQPTSTRARPSCMGEARVISYLDISWRTPAASSTNRASRALSSRGSAP